MNTSQDPLLITLHLNAVEDTDVENLNQGIQEDLRHLDDAMVELPYADVSPDRAKSGGLAPIDWTTLFVTLATSGALTALIQLVQARLTQERKVTLEIDRDKLEVKGLSSEEQKRLIDARLQRHQKSKKTHG